MFVYLIIKIIPFIVRGSPVKTNQFVGLVFNTNIKITAAGIGKTSDCFKPAYNIVPVQFTFAFEFIAFQ